MSKTPMNRMTDERLIELRNEWHYAVRDAADEILEALLAERAKVRDLEGEIQFKSERIHSLVNDYNRVMLGNKDAQRLIKSLREGHTVTVEYNLTPAMHEGAIRSKLIELGWTPPKGGNDGETKK